MVNRGKSYGCHTCRQRKIKCDELRPQCTQCTKSNRTCLGYPSRDAPRISRKAGSSASASASSVGGSDRKHSIASDERRISISGSVSSDTSGFLDALSPIPSSSSLHSLLGHPSTDGLPSRWPSQVPGAWQSGSSNIVIPTTTTTSPLYPDDNEIVLDYFKRNFFTPDAVGLQHMLHATRDGSNVLQQAILSLGTLGLANTRGSEQDVARARHRYGVALRTANRCLKDPVSALHDDTLSAILLLGMFECMDTRCPTKIDQWADHVKGAFQIVKARGGMPASPRTARSTFFYRVRALFTVICLYRNIPVPKETAQWSQETEAGDSLNLPSLYLRQPFLRVILEIADELCALQGAIRERQLATTDDILTPLHRIEQNLIGWANPARDPEYSFEGMRDASFDPDNVWLGVFHWYRSHHVYMTFYHYRNVRLYNMLLLGVWLHRSGRSPYGSEEQVQQLSDRLELIDQVLGSVPWKLGYMGNRTDSPSANFSQDGDHMAVPAMWGFTCMWALAFACDALIHESALAHFLLVDDANCATMKERAQQQLIWALNRLLYIDQRLGIRQAGALAKLYRNVWMRYFGLDRLGPELPGEGSEYDCSVDSVDANSAAYSTRMGSFSPRSDRLSPVLGGGFDDLALPEMPPSLGQSLFDIIKREQM